MQPNPEAPPRRAQCPPTWADEQLASLRERLPDWDVWYVPTFMGPTRGVWCAKPSGARVATCHGGDPDTLILAAGEFTERLADHIAVARGELAAPPLWPDRRGVLEDQLSAMTRLQGRRQAASTHEAAR
jgi:hypothetical protein